MLTLTYAQKAALERRCAECGGRLLPGCRADRRWCSGSCSMKAYRRRKAATA